MNKIINTTLTNIIKEPIKYRVVLWFWALFIFVFLIWASFASIDEIVRGQGKIIASSKNQIIQNFEGGIMQNIKVQEGDIVKKGDVLVQISNKKNTSLFELDKLSSATLDVRIARLKAQAYDMEFLVKDFMKNYPNLLSREQSLYNTNIKKVNSHISIFQEQVKQHNSSLKEEKIRIKHLKKSYSLIKEEIDLIKPLVRQGIKSKIDLINLQKELNKIEQAVNLSKESIPRYVSLIKESENKIKNARNSFKSKSKEELNKNVIELQKINFALKSTQDSVDRTLLRAPTNGIVKKIFINTLGGVVKSGEDIMELVPTDDTLLVQAKIKPSDIAFIYASQDVIVKFTAYDFALFGALKGKVVKISADTYSNKQMQDYYEVSIKTNKNYLSKNNRKLPIIPGMIVNVDILTGKKTVLDYILKPILKTKQYAFTQR